jgi:hypothetical protein
VQRQSACTGDDVRVGDGRELDPTWRVDVREPFGHDREEYRYPESITDPVELLQCVRYWWSPSTLSPRCTWMLAAVVRQAVDTRSAACAFLNLTVVCQPARRATSEQARPDTHIALGGPCPTNPTRRCHGATDRGWDRRTAR